MYQQIPQELRIIPQWVSAGPNKLPLNSRTGQAASVTDPSTWSTFEQAVQAGYKHIGFVLTENDPYGIVDLDKPKTDEQAARHGKIVEMFESYTELSQSGEGVHIVTRGAIPTGVRRDKVEIYSTARYMIFTGNIIKDLPIRDCQELLTTLHNEMASADTVELHEAGEVMEDEEVFEMATNASNADKFNQLCSGIWEGEWPSQSEADLALMSMFAYYTQSNEQVRRLFRMSALGKREKATRNDKYLNYCLGKIRAQQPAPINLDKMEDLAIRAVTEAQEKTLAQAPPMKGGMEYPPGIVGEIAKYVYASAIRPVPEIALAASIALCAGICGRSYNISGTGLNQYIILLAKTGSGKEGAASGIDALVSAARASVPMVDEFIGPGSFASGQALIKVLDERPSFVSILGEFGLTLQQLCDANASPHHIMLRRVLLDLYSKSGWNKTLRSSVYSDVEKNTRIVQAPNVSILGEATPESFYAGLDQTHIAEGLIPRFSIIEYDGPRPERNPNAFCSPAEGLVNQFSQLVAIALTTQQNGTCAPVQTDPAAIRLFDKFDKHADNVINAAKQDTDMQLWNRAHLKALKVAALIAVGVNPHQPIVTEEYAEWAIRFVNRDINTILKKFSEGQVGVGDHKQENDIREAIEAYLVMPAEKRIHYKVPKAILGEQVIPYSYLRRRLKMKTAFKNDRRGAGQAIQSCLADMVRAEVLDQMPKQQCREKFRINSDMYTIGQFW